jgi:hypothetical protein
MRLWMTFLACLVGPGDEKKEVQVVCPVDGHRFTALEVTVTNHWGGRDPDGCYHAFKTTPLEYLVWICPACSFAGLKKDFTDLKLTEEEKRTLGGGLKPAVEIKRGARQADIPGHVKYDLLAQGAALRKAPPEQVGRAHLYASWSARQQGAAYLNDFDEWEQLRTSYGLNRTPMDLGKKNRTDLELEQAQRLEKDIEGKKYEKGPNRILSRYLAAYLYRKHGENGPAEKWLAETAKFKGENSIVDEAAARMSASIPLEREHQKKAIDAYVAAVDGGKLDKKVAAEVAYLVAELYRRRGEKDSADSWYQSAIEQAATPELKQLAEAQRARLK